MNSEEVIRKIKELDLPKGEYVVVGGAALAVRRIRDCADIDIFVTPRAYAELKNRGWQEKVPRFGDSILGTNDIEIGEISNLAINNYHPRFEELISRAERIAGIPFTSLKDVITYKSALGREKDLADIQLIEDHLQKQEKQGG